MGVAAQHQISSGIDSQAGKAHLGIIRLGGVLGAGVERDYREISVACSLTDGSGHFLRFQDSGAGGVARAVRLRYDGRVGERQKSQPLTLYLHIAGGIGFLLISAGAGIADPRFIKITHGVPYPPGTEIRHMVVGQ